MFSKLILIMQVVIILFDLLFKFLESDPDFVKASTVEKVTRHLNAMNTALKKAHK